MAVQMQSGQQGQKPQAVSPAGQKGSGQQGQGEKKAQAASPAGQKSTGQQGQGNKKPQAGQKSPAQQGQPEKKPQGMTEEQQKREAAQAAQKAQEYKKKANYYLQAAYGAGDPDERQKLMEKYLDENIKAEKFGKTAKYLQSGGGQGFAAGAGLGVGIGVALGTLTATLVGGPTSLITGGIGAVAGAIHGPFFNLAEMGGSAIRKITGDLPGWKATPEQKKALEKMCGQIEETDEPSAEELENITGNSMGEVNPMIQRAEDKGNSWADSAQSWVPDKSSLPSWASGEPKKETNVQKQQKLDAAKKSQDTKSSLQSASDEQAKAQSQPKSEQGKQASSNTAKLSSSAGQDGAKPARSQPRKLGKPSATSAKQSSAPTPSTTGSQPNGSGASSEAQTPSKPSNRPLTSTNCNTAKSDSSAPASATKKKPRKLEPRSAGTSKPDTTTTGSQSQTSTPARRTPKKLESRA